MRLAVVLLQSLGRLRKTQLVLTHILRHLIFIILIRRLTSRQEYTVLVRTIVVVPAFVALEELVMNVDRVDDIV